MFGKHTNIQIFQTHCLCGRQIVEQCYLCPNDSKHVSDVNHCIKRWGSPNTVRGDPKNKVECTVCNCMVDKTNIKRHCNTAKHKRNSGA